MTWTLFTLCVSNCHTNWCDHKTYIHTLLFSHRKAPDGQPQLALDYLRFIMQHSIIFLTWFCTPVYAIKLGLSNWFWICVIGALHSGFNITVNYLWTLRVCASRHERTHRTHAVSTNTHSNTLYVNTVCWSGLMEFVVLVSNSQYLTWNISYCSCMDGFRLNEYHLSSLFYFQKW